MRLAVRTARVLALFLLFSGFVPAVNLPAGDGERAGDHAGDHDHAGERNRDSALARSGTLFSFAAALHAQDYSVSDTIFLPSQYYVGDTVEMRFILRSRFISRATVPPELPVPDWGRIQDVRLIPRGSDLEVRLRFVAFEPGTKTLPTLNLGPLALDDLNVFVSSILEPDRTELLPPRGQVLLPGTQVLIILFIAAIVLLPLIWIFVLRVVKPRILAILHRRREGRPYRDLLKFLRGIRPNADTLPARTFYIDLLNNIRAYLARRFGVSALSFTSSELDHLIEALVTEKDDCEKLTELFRHADQVKFANQTSSITHRMEHLDLVERAFGRVEERERTRRELSERKARGSKDEAGT